MLAKIGKPFSSDEFSFEIKWDGTRGLCFVEHSGFRLLNRKKRNMRETYPELTFADRLDPGILLDGEVVSSREGNPEFGAMLQREQARGRRAKRLSQTLPAVYVAFDLLYEKFDPMLDFPLGERRERLERIVEKAADPRLVFSQSVDADGETMFEQSRERGLEGIIAKRLDSRYLPGRRTDAWLKIKARQSIYCAIIGFLPEADDEVRSLVIATEREGELRCVGRVGSGLTRTLRHELFKQLRDKVRPEPIVPIPVEKLERETVWVEPDLLCTVSFFEWTSRGELRAPVFEQLVADG